MPPSSETLLITDTDMDGSCCAIAVLKAYPDADIEYESHKTVDDRVRSLVSGDGEGYKRVLVADMLPSDKELVKRLHAKFPEVRIFDHHEAQEYLNDLEGCRHDFEACSGLITTQELGLEEGYLKFAEVVDVWDRFQDKSETFPQAKRLTMLHNFIGQKAFVARGPKPNPQDEFEDRVMDRLEEAEEEQLEQALENLRVFVLPDGLVLAMLAGVNSPLLFSSPTVAQGIYSSKPEVDMVAVWHPNTGSVSLYSRHGGVDVSEIARHFGGGGHAGAAGFRPRADLIKLIARSLFL